MLLLKTNEILSQNGLSKISKIPQIVYKSPIINKFALIMVDDARLILSNFLPVLLQSTAYNADIVFSNGYSIEELIRIIVGKSDKQKGREPVILMDLQMDPLERYNGYDVTIGLKNINPNCKIIGFTADSYEDETIHKKFKKAGAIDSIAKTTPLTSITSLALFLNGLKT